MHPISISFVLNIITLILKILGLTDTKSSALFADVLNDLGDCVGLLLLLVGLRLARKRRSSIAYPFGMSRAVYVFGLISISIVGGVLFSIAMINTLSGLSFDTPTIESGRAAPKFVIPALIVNSFNLLYVARSFLSKRHRDPAALGAFIDGVTDFIGSLFAAAAVITLIRLVDVVGGVAVSAILLVSAISLGYRYFVILIGRAPPKHELLKILSTALSVPGVRDVNELKAIMLTENEYLVILEIETDRDAEVEDLESLSKTVEHEIRKALPKAKHIVIEFVPARHETPTYKTLITEISSMSE